MSPESARRKAFTLIELLIVVAIIAILAAIAVPNFLEAQTRAKVSRAKNDLRTMATAMEAKAIDNNGKYNIALSSTWILNNFRSLTTPVSYLTSIPQDPFIPASQLGFPGVNDPNWNQDASGKWVQTGTVPTYPSYIFQWYDGGLPAAGGATPFDRNPHPNYPTYYSDPSSIYYPGFMQVVGTVRSRMWIIVSGGPQYLRAANGVTPSRGVDWRLGPYDPTNGSVSTGLISRSGP